MKTLRKLLILVVVLTMTTGWSVLVSADTATDLSDMKVYAVDGSGKKTEVAMNFESTTYTYDLTVMSDVVKIEIEATPADSSSKWVVEKEWANTRMDVGKNLTEVAVTSASGAVQKYTLNTTKLTAEEQATYQADETESVTKKDDTAAVKKDKDTKVTVGKKEMKISTSFDKNDIPEGFKKTTAEYNGKKYKCIKGEVKDLTAFYLYDDETEGFYIYDESSDKFYVMNNIQVKSRMYTIVQPEKTDGILKNYDKETVTIIDQKVDAWVLDDEEGMYLVYAMNWNGETSLYSYDDNEKCFQRYLVSLDSNKQSEAAATAYENLQKDYNKLVDKYNILLRVLCGLVVVIIILVFVIINLALNKKEKKVKKAKNKKSDKIDDLEDNIIAEEFDAEVAADEQDDLKELEEVEEDLDISNEPVEETEDAAVLPDEVQEADNPEEDLESEKPEENENTLENDEEEIALKHKLFGRRNADIPYGDKPTFGTEEESEEGFYGGEVESEAEVLIDLTDDTMSSEKQEKIEKETENAQQEAEEDLRETLKSMLPKEQEEEDDDDDDFEFIDLD